MFGPQLRSQPQWLGGGGAGRGVEKGVGSGAQNLLSQRVLGDSEGGSSDSPLRAAHFFGLGGMCLRSLAFPR